MIGLATIERFAATAGDRPAVIATDTLITWSDYDQRVRALVPWLATRLTGVASPRAVISATASPGYLVLTSALATLGVPWVGLDPQAPAERSARQLDQVQPSLLGLNAGSRAAEVDALVTRRPELTVVDVDRLPGTDGAAAPLMRTGANEPTGPAPRSPWKQSWEPPPFLALGFTSGTTGTPKLVLRSTPSEQLRLQALVARYAFDQDDTHLVTVPFSHASGHGWARVLLSVGATVVLATDTSPEELVHLTEHHRIRTTLMVPPVLAAFTAAAEQSSADLGSLRFCVSGGRQIPPDLLRRATQRLGPVVTTYYGTTETGLNLVADLSDLAVEPLTAGRPLPGNRVLVMSSTGLPAPCGTVGRVAINSYMAMDGYDDGAADERIVDGERYLVTPDFGYLDDQGRLFLLGREDGLPGAEGVPIIQAEAQLRRLPDVADCVVLRLRSECAPVATAALTLRSADRGGEVVREAGRMLGDLLPTAPRWAAVVPEIPYGPTGKVRSGPLIDLLRQATNQEM
ncbi:MAG: class I adenylate-forming enzyme family protein [Phycicoccus sp.]